MRPAAPDSTALPTNACVHATWVSIRQVRCPRKAAMLPWFDRSHAPFFAVEIVVLSTMTSLGMIGGLGVLARRGRAWRIACLTLAAAMSAASTHFVLLLLTID